jgi:15-cis-phytoene synthase
VSAGRTPDEGALGEANRYCAALARAESHDQWLGALYAAPSARDALNALAAFDHEIRQALMRARDPNLAAMRLAWWRGAIAGERPDEAAGSPVALALLAAIDAYAPPRAWLEAMLDARLQEIAPQADFNLAAFRAFADESEGARLRLAALIAAGGVELDEAEAHAPAGMALALTRLLHQLPFKAGSAPMLIPADVAARHGASTSEFDARRLSLGVVAACAELRDLARDELAEAERRLEASSPAILPAFIPLGPLRLDLDRLGRNAARPFEPAGEISPLRRQWAIWRWARTRRRLGRRHDTGADRLNTSS